MTPPLTPIDTAGRIARMRNEQRRLYACVGDLGGALAAHAWSDAEDLCDRAENLISDMLQDIRAIRRERKPGHPSIPPS